MSGRGRWDNMLGKVRHHRVHLYPYEVIDTPLWSLPLIGPSPTPLPPYPRPCKRLPRKIHLVVVRERDL